MYSYTLTHSKDGWLVACDGVDAGRTFTALPEALEFIEMTDGDS